LEYAEVNTAAVVLTGLVRTYAKTNYSLKRNVLDINNADVYLSFWDKDEMGNPIDVSAVLDIYKPVSYEILSHDEYEETREPFVFNDRSNDCFHTNIRAYLSRRNVGTRNLERYRSQFYAVKRGIKLVKNSYNAVMRTRFDIEYKSKMSMYHIDSGDNKFYVPEVGRDVFNDHYITCGLTTPVISDHWCYGNPTMMQKYGEQYDNILKVYQEDNVPPCNAEEFMAHYCLNIMKGVKVIDSTPYAIIR